MGVLGPVGTSRSEKSMQMLSSGDGGAAEVAQLEQRVEVLAGHLAQAEQMLATNPTSQRYIDTAAQVRDAHSKTFAELERCRERERAKEKEAVASAAPSADA